jgi:hypothetical protein
MHSGANGEGLLSKLDLQRYQVHLAKELGMKDLLPNVTLKADVQPVEFLSRFEKLAAAHGHYETYRDTAPEVEGGWELLGLRFRGSTPHKGLAGQLVVTPIDNPELMVKVLASQWQPDLNYRTYVGAVHEVFDPLLLTYNRTFRARRRLTIPSQESLEPTLPPKAGKAFRSFVDLANKNALHPLDWRRFYQFVKFSHQGGIQATAADIERLLVNSGFEESYAEEIARVYYHGRELAKIL